MIWALLAKDLVRFRRNPLPWLIFLAVPLCITALIGFAFGPRSSGAEFARIRFALVDEDDSVLTQFLRGGLGQGQGGKYLEPVFLKREEALRQILDNQLSAAVILPPHFTSNYLTGHGPIALELIKNPAQSIHPAILEELMAALVTGLNAVSRNLQSEFPDWLAVFEGREDYTKVAELIRRGGDRLKAAKPYVAPPLVTYTKESRTKPADPAAKAGGSGFNIFGYLLPGLTAMFLLFLANTAMMDLHREVENRTVQRFRTLHHGLQPWVATKVAVGVVMLLLCAAILLGGGSLIFRIHWQHPVALVGLTVAYCFFAVGFLAMLTALIPNERRANTLNTLITMGLALAGGCAFPAESLPPFLRDHISPLLPTFQFVQTVRHLEFGGAAPTWWLFPLAWAGAGLVMIIIATRLLRRRFERGGAA